ncbi:MAG: VanW family protein [Lachnospiraceae bacterium]|nr:VanW family protein [Lachnospiraceae bacterium]MCH4028930.1 VanW family protein [Lachnospiraceae bacterium]MCH4066784.1 VanW family protein [Lachnospiraceae bacterium]MCH4112811.1 VanW family protein [Lachnospiraceae bacterium]MCI1353191.1 VanW family protein [Lachnospiraceae bacterium]
MIHSRDEKSFYEKLHKTAVPVTLSILSAAMAVTAAFSACPAKAYAAVGTDSSGTAESSDMEDTANTAGTGSSASDAADMGTAADSAGSPADSSETADSAATALLHPTRMIMNGITINGIDVGGMTEEEAASKLRSAFADYGNATITLEGQDSSETVSVPASRFGVGWTDVSAVDEAGACGHGTNIIARYKSEKDIQQNGMNFTANMTADEGDILDVLENDCSSFEQEAVDASLTRENGSFTVSPGQSGVVIDHDSSASKIKSVLEDGWTGENEIIALDMEVSEPNGTAEELEQVKDLLGTFTTSYSSSGEARCQNIANACGMINGTVVYPGQQFSVLQTITPFTEENGYALAGSYFGQQVVESFGGGICQVSTTLYNAVIRAELQVDERHNHSLIVSYVDPSDDAAIAESSGLDFRFTNNLEIPIYIEGSISGKSITFNIYGHETRDPGRTLAFESETIETTDPEGEAVYTDNTQQVGYISYTAAHQGVKARLWKVVYQDGVEKSREVFNNSTYNAAPKSCTVGTLGTVTANLQEAIDSQSIEGCEAAIATLAQDQAAEAAGLTPQQQAAQAQIDEIQQIATQAANDAYAQAIANGADEATALAAAQTASEQAAAAAQEQIAASAGTAGDAAGTADGTEASDAAQ